MCTAHPYNHGCRHNSVQWNFCPRSTINFQTGTTTPCDNQHSARPMDTEDPCPIWVCRWEDKGGVWKCCQCGGKPNRMGWCVFERPRLVQNAITGEWENVRYCNHTCCDNCTAWAEGGKLPESLPLVKDRTHPLGESKKMIEERRRREEEKGGGERFTS